MKLIPIPLVGRALSLGEIGLAVCLGGSLGSLFTEGWDCDPTSIVVWPGLLSTNGKARFSQNRHLLGKQG